MNGGGNAMKQAIFLLVIAAAGPGQFGAGDGGASWNSASSGLKANFISGLLVNPQNSSALYP